MHYFQKLFAACFMLGLIFNPEDGSDMFIFLSADLHQKML
jgi:hypothetical protein